MKKLIYILGTIFLIMITILNLLFTAHLDANEHISITNNNCIYISGIILISALIYIISKIINKYIYNDKNEKSKKNFRIVLFIVAILIYIICNIIWIIRVIPPVIGDQIHVVNLAQTFYSGDSEKFLPNLTYAGIPLSQYMQSYHQQISLAFIFSIIFKRMHCDAIPLLRLLNIASNFLIIIAIYIINKQLSKKYKTNNTLLLILMLTFISIPMLSNFIYGDIPSLALCLFSVYFMMKYTETKKVKYIIIATILAMIAYMMRMNSLIFIIATTIYLVLDLFNDKKDWKENLLKIILILMYIVISIIPSTLVKNYYLDKYNLNKNKSYPNISYILMGMEESPRANGWYNEKRGEYALNNIESAKTEYIKEIKERLTYFTKNVGYTINFYTMKIASMWTENTYSAIRNNTTKENDPIKQFINPLTFYQKSLLIITCLSSFIVLIQNRKNLSMDLIFLITIFIGGFAFHILWEAKSRYIIPYIVILIPIASIKLNEIKLNNKS